jgi:hypothetical protein
VAEVSPPPQSADALEYIHPTAFSAGVYAYCYPAYRELAAQRGELHWPVKIGMSDLDITSRVAAQAATALPEAPELICEFTSDTPRLLERAIHSILALRGRIMDDAPGSEWFMTNPDELREIVEWIGGDDRD